MWGCTFQFLIGILFDSYNIISQPAGGIDQFQFLIGILFDSYLRSSGGVGPSAGRVSIPYRYSIRLLLHHVRCTKGSNNPGFNSL